MSVQRRHRQPRGRSELFEFEFEELFDEEFEFELLEEFDELFDDEFELELLDELELELLDELDELLPATMMDPSLRLVAVLDCRSMSIAGPECCLASTAVLATAAIPATRTEVNLLYFVIAVTPVCRTCIRSGGVTVDPRHYSTPARGLYNRLIFSGRDRAAPRPLRLFP
jgi:hypothetical protein